MSTTTTAAAAPEENGPQARRTPPDPAAQQAARLGEVVAGLDPFKAGDLGQLINAGAVYLRPRFDSPAPDGDEVTSFSYTPAAPGPDAEQAPPVLRMLDYGDPATLAELRRALVDTPEGPMLIPPARGGRRTIVRVDTDHGPILAFTSAPERDARAVRLEMEQHAAGPVHARLPRRFQLLDDEEADVLGDGVDFGGSGGSGGPSNGPVVVRWRGFHGAPSYLSIYNSMADAEADASRRSEALVTTWIDA